MNPLWAKGQPNSRRNATTRFRRGLAAVSVANFLFFVIPVKSTTLPGSSSTETRILSEATTTVWLATGKSSWKQSHRCRASASSSSSGCNDGLHAGLLRFVPPPTVPLYGAWRYMVLVHCTIWQYEQKCTNVFHFCVKLKMEIKNDILIMRFLVVFERRSVPHMRWQYQPRTQTNLSK